MLVDTLKQLKHRKAAIRTEIAKLNVEDRKIDRVIKAISALPVAASAPVATAAKTKPAKKRKMSAAGRKAISLAAKAMWAKRKAKKK